MSTLIVRVLLGDVAACHRLRRQHRLRSETQDLGVLVDFGLSDPGFRRSVEQSIGAR